MYQLQNVWQQLLVLNFMATASHCRFRGFSPCIEIWPGYAHRVTEDFHGISFISNKTGCDISFSRGFQDPDLHGLFAQKALEFSNLPPEAFDVRACNEHTYRHPWR
jgi:hypothetical protein